MALQEVSKRVAAAHDTDEVLDLIVNEAARLVGSSGSYIRLLEGESLVTRAATESLGELGSMTLVVGEGLMGHVMATKKPQVMENVEEEELLTPEMRKLVQTTGFVSAAAVPLLANNISVGVLAVMDTNIRRFTEDEVSLLSAFADQAALALEKARLLNEAEARERQATQLYEVTNQLASNHDLESLLDLIAEQAAELTGGKGAAIFRYDEAREGLVIATMHNFDPEFKDMFVRPGEGNAGRAYVERRAIWTNDLMADASVVYSDDDTHKMAREFSSKWGVLGVVAAPIMIQDEVYGILDVLFDLHREFTDEEINLVQNLADSAAVAINNARFIEEIEQARDEATQLYEITEQLASAADMDTVLDLITVKATELLGSHGSAMMRFDEARDLLVTASAHNIAPELFERITARPGVGLTGRAFQERRPMWTRNAPTDESLNPPEGDAARAVEEVGVGAVLAVPVIVRDEAYGALNVFYPGTHDFSDDEVRLLQTLADSAAVAIGNARFIEEIQQRTAELDATNQELEAFSYSVSHDQRAPLRGIDGFSQALLNEYSDVLDEQAQHYLERVRTGSQRMGQLIDDLLALSQVTRGEMRRENVDLSELARTIVTGLQERDPERQVEFVIQDGVVLNGDTRLLRVALENLLGNAWKYTGKKQEARIEFGLTEDDGKRTCFIRDDGSGFDMAYADRLFGAFQRLHDASEFEGSGIGLATVQRIIHRHGGRIWAESAVGEGATFYFTLH